MSSLKLLDACFSSVAFLEQMLKEKDNKLKEKDNTLKDRLEDRDIAFKLMDGWLKERDEMLQASLKAKDSWFQELLKQKDIQISELTERAHKYEAEASDAMRALIADAGKVDASTSLLVTWGEYHHLLRRCPLTYS
jgi:hypothetical protein